MTQLARQIKYALDESFYGHFCPRRKAANFCHPAVFTFNKMIKAWACGQSLELLRHQYPPIIPTRSNPYYVYITRLLRCGTVCLLDFIVVRQKMHCRQDLRGRSDDQYLSSYFNQTNNIFLLLSDEQYLSSFLIRRTIFVIV